MDSLRKKLNEKRSPKKESKYLCLQEQDVHTLTGLLKMFFRELHPTLMPKAVFVACTSGKLPCQLLSQVPCSLALTKLIHSFRFHFHLIFVFVVFAEKLSASQMREKLAEMPALNYALLKYLFKHFKSIERYEKDNLMSAGMFN